MLRSNGRPDLPSIEGLHICAPAFWDRRDQRRGIWAYIPARWFMEQFMDLDRLSDITTSISRCFTKRPAFENEIPRTPKIKKWGARLVYEDNASEFFSSIAPPGLEHEFYSCLSYCFGKGILGVIPPLPFIDLSHVQERRVRQYYEGA